MVDSRSGRRQPQYFAWFFLLWAVGLGTSALAAEPAEPSGAARGWSLYLDNDAFTPFVNRDEDYTGGFAATFAGPAAGRGLGFLDRPLAAVDRAWLPLHSGFERPALPALQLGLMVFVPGNIGDPDLIDDDRPYAGLLYLANGRTYVADDGRVAYKTSLLLGVVGLDLTSDIQKELHRGFGATPPQGWHHQISKGGEPTARYAAERQDRLAAGNALGQRYDLASSVGGSAGFLTQADAALSLRWGRIGTAWWSFAPQTATYLAAPGTSPVVDRASRRELYLWAGIKTSLRFYNVLLQGQFRDSQLSYDFADTRPLIGEAWFGVTAQASDTYRLSWAVHYQSSELRNGTGNRDLLWGGITLSRSL